MYRLEIWILAFCVVYIANIFVGKRTNDAIAGKWANTFCRVDGVLDRNFALIGTGSF